ncbi:hypothetical protein Nepgr_009306 [Nepenthes gracilis]|uniref:Uncharacterized protein n=1 Tax=Nepenthes gracilis TaxID=150966 RepID=A0AAD3SAL9_NEPGR|nr:hypothetical protein Nepgr_009306 [Nepenthes gracilis]
MRFRLVGILTEIQFCHGGGFAIKPWDSMALFCQLSIARDSLRLDAEMASGMLWHDICYGPRYMLTDLQMTEMEDSPRSFAEVTANGSAEVITTEAWVERHADACELLILMLVLRKICILLEGAS